MQLGRLSRAAADGADYLLLPIPLGVGSAVYAPHASEPIVADESAVLEGAPRAPTLFCGRATPELRAGRRRRPAS